VTRSGAAASNAVYAVDVAPAIVCPANSLRVQTGQLSSLLGLGTLSPGNEPFFFLVP
jgi:hypothetical protein